MKKPELVISESQGRAYGRCSSCPGEEFKAVVQMDSPGYVEFLQTAFKTHFKAVHLREDASQAAARIVREATKDTK
jgi:hypothetical protein